MSSLFGHADGSTEPSDRETPPFASIGLGTLTDLFDDDRSEIAGLLEAAIASIDSDVALLASAAAAGDRPGVVAAAHRIKGTSGSIGAGVVVEHSSQIESAVTRLGRTITAAMLDELRGAVDCVRRDIAGYVADAGSA